MTKISTPSSSPEVVTPDSRNEGPSRLTLEKIRQFARAYMSAPVGGIVLN